MAAIVAVGLMGCAAPLSDHPDNDVPLSVEDHVYGYLETDQEGRYRFTKFALTEAAVSSSEPWVRLTDLSPMWDTTGIDECIIVPSFNAHKVKVPCQEKTDFFMVERTDLSPSAMAGNVFRAAFTAGLGLLAYRPGYVTFDHGAFEKAAAEAASGVPDLNQKLAQIDRATNMSDQQLADYQAISVPELRYNILDQLPAVTDLDGRFLDLMSHEYVSDIPVLSIEELEAPEAWRDFRPGAVYPSISALMSSVDALGDEGFSIGVTCTSAPTNRLSLDYTCPGRIPLEEAPVVVDIKVQSASLSAAEMGRIEKVSSGGLSVAFNPVSDYPWEVTNLDSVPVQLNRMDVAYGAQHATLNLSGIEVLEPGETGVFGFTSEVYSRFQPSIDVQNHDLSRTFDWQIDIKYRPHGESFQSASIGGTHTLEDVLAATAEVGRASQNGPLSLEDRLNRR